MYCAAVIGPIPYCWSSWGATAVISSAIDVFSSVISVARMRRATERMACLVAVSSLTEAGRIRNAEHLATRAAVFRPRSWSRRSIGAVTTRAFSSHDSRHPGGLGAFSGGLQHSQGFAVSPSPWDRWPRAAQHLAGGPPSVQCVGFGAVAGRGGIVELHHQFPSGGEIGGHACSVTARAFHRPHPVSRLSVLVCPFQQPVISQPGGPNTAVACSPVVEVSTTEAVTRSRSGSIPITCSTIVSNIRKPSLSCATGLFASQGANRDGRTVMSHTPCGWTSF